MRKCCRRGWEQTYNAQVVVDADAGYASSNAFENPNSQVDLCVGVSAAGHRERQHEFRPPKPKPAMEIANPGLVAMSEKVRSEEGRRI